MNSEVDQSWFIRPPGIPAAQSAGGVVVRFQDGDVLVALIQERVEGQYVLPKGHVEPGESLEEAAVREIEEEAGLAGLTLIKKLGQTERLSFDRSEWKETHYFLFTTEQVRGIPSDPRTKGEAAWFPISQLPSMFWSDQQDLVETHLEFIQSLTP